MKKTYVEVDIRLFYFKTEDIVTLSLGIIDDAQSHDLVQEDRFSN